MTRGPTPALPDWRVEEHDSLPSTQDLIRARLEASEDVDGLVVRAGVQPAGRGQRSKSWTSERGGSYQSLAVRDRSGGALRLPGTTLLLAVELAAALRGAGANASVKWPNDLYLAGGKLGGILTEYTSEHLIVGIGVNVNNAVPAGASALAGWRLERVNELVLQAVSAALTTLVRAGGADRVGLPARLAPLDLLAERTVTVRTPGGDIGGRANGVAANGALLVLTAGGEVAVTSGSVVAWDHQGREAHA